MSDVVPYMQTMTSAASDWAAVVTEPIRVLAARDNQVLIDSIKSRLEISINKHNSDMIAIAGHFDCSGNPVEENIQKEQIKLSMEFVREWFPQVKIRGLWIDVDWQVKEIDT